MRTALLAIDAQVDFCDPSGALFVAGADADMRRAAAWIDRERERIDHVVATLDSHHVFDIAHPAWWLDAEGRHPEPFTVIQAEDLRAGRFRPAHDAWTEASHAYVEHLAHSGRKALVVWPPHCLLGSPGHALAEPIRRALGEWETARGTAVEFVLKGLNPATEHYSAVRAEMPIPGDSSTGFNEAMVASLDRFDRIVVVGEAKSHCVADTVTDLAERIDPRKFVLLEDAMSSVGGFEGFGDAFCDRSRTAGMTFAKSESYDC